MVLAIDIGNTDTVYGMFSGNRLVSEWRTYSTPAPAGAVVRQTLLLLCKETGISPTEIEGTVISSVNPHNCRIIDRVIAKWLKNKPFVISGDKELGMNIRYQQPQKLGADRICNAIAAIQKYGTPAIIVDFGTAITYDVVSAKGEFIGGLIAAGIQTTASALASKTAALPEVRPELPRQLIGTSTEECLQSGIMYSTIEAVNGIVRRLKKELGKQTVVIATGGFAGLIARHSSVIDFTEPSLVLDGARLLYELQQRKKKKRGKR
jgi:type III pantothenate kinase